MRNKEKLHSIVVCLAFIYLISISPAASAKEITVGDDAEADFISIQEAVNNSSSGDVILVSPGSYNESVDIVLQNISILSKSENPKDTTVRAFKLSVNNITVSGFSVQEGLTLQGPRDERGYPKIENCAVKNNILKLGINADECYNSTIEKNVILNSGIYIQGSDGSNFTISDNLIVNGHIDVYQGPSNCVLLNNTLLKGNVGFTECGNHKIFGNCISNSSEGSGISLWESYSNKIENNTVVNCSNGISMEYLSSLNIINNNTLTTCSDKGIWIKGWGGGGNSLLNNNISNNNIGIWVGEDSSNNLVANNKVELNKKCGVYLNGIAYTKPFNQTNRFYNNIFNNTVNVFNDTNSYYTAENVGHGARIFPVAWNTTKTSGTNIVGGPYLGGNYWAKPDETGFSQICADSDRDGICDLSYNINESDIDYLPLTTLPMQHVDGQFTIKETPIVTNESDQQYPIIYGNSIVWVDWRSGDNYNRNANIYMYEYLHV